MRRWITLGIVGLVAYFGWRKFGGRITNGVTKLAA